MQFRMELLLLRHGTAEDHGHPLGDAARALVEKGRGQSRAAGRFLTKIDCLPELVLASPMVRARQTAEEFCAEAGLGAPVEAPWLACGMAPEEALGELRAYADFGRVMIVGHEPDFSGLVCFLLGAGGGTVRMKKGGVALLRLHGALRHGELQFLLPPRAMR